MKSGKWLLCSALLPALFFASVGRGAGLDLRNAVPNDVYLAMRAKHNPERDFQRVYYENVWNAVQETKILERGLKILTRKTSEEDMEKAKAVLDEIRQAAAPIDVKAILNAEEMIYAQTMQGPSAQHLGILRLTRESAATTEEGLKNLFGLIEKYSEGRVPVQTSTQGNATITTLKIRERVPFSPTFARLDDLIFLSSSKTLLEQSLDMLVSGDGESKFDDPRFKEAMKRLPEPEDSVVFYDARTQFEQLKGIEESLREMSRGNPDIERVIEILNLVIRELSIIDCEVTVEYTEDNLNRAESYGVILPDASEKVLGEALLQGESFPKWDRWVPANARSFSLSMGINLLPIYNGLVWLVDNKIPEAQPILARFNAIQDQLDVDLKSDILEAFTGENVSVAIPPAVPSLFGGGQESLTALRCQKPDRVRELLHRLVEQLQQQDALRSQQLKFVESETLEGFEELSATGLAPFGVRPVIGFRDGWMYLASRPRVINKVLETQAGEGDSIVDSDTFQQFRLEVEGPVASIRYANLEAGTRQAAMILSQAGMFAPMVLGAMNAENNTQDLKPLQEVLALLPSVGKIVRQFDFLQAKLTVTQEANCPNTYTRRSVTIVRPPEPEPTSDESDATAEE